MITASSAAALSDVVLLDVVLLSWALKDGAAGAVASVAGRFNLAASMAALIAASLSCAPGSRTQRLLLSESPPAVLRFPAAALERGAEVVALDSDNVGDCCTPTSEPNCRKSRCQSFIAGLPAAGTGG